MRDALGHSVGASSSNFLSFTHFLLRGQFIALERTPVADCFNNVATPSLFEMRRESDFLIASLGAGTGLAVPLWILM